MWLEDTVEGVGCKQTPAWLGDTIEGVEYRQTPVWLGGHHRRGGVQTYYTCVVGYLQYETQLVSLGVWLGEQYRGAITQHARC